MDELEHWLLAKQRRERKREEKREREAGREKENGIVRGWRWPIEAAGGL